MQHRIYITGEGYTRDDREAFVRDAQAAIDALALDPEVGDAFVRATNCVIFTPSEGRGLGGVFGSRREDDGDLRLDLESVMRWRRDRSLDQGDALIVIVNAAFHGGAFQSLSNTCYYTARGSHALEVLKHEFLGHLVGRCGDEYGGRGQYPPSGGGPQAPNLSIHADPARVPWAAFVGQPDGMGGDRLVGVYEGGGGFDRGVYRPTRTGRMRAINRPFGPVVREAILRGLERFTPARPGVPGDLNGDGRVDFADLNLALESGDFGAVNETLANFGGDR